MTTMRPCWARRWFSLVMALLVSGCTTSQLVPSDMEARISRSVTLHDLKADPGKFKGQWVALGGKVLRAKRLKNETQIELLQLPLAKTDRPIPDLQRSQGRFLAVQQEFLDPATLPAGTLMSLVGEVIGAKTAPLDDTEYTYPVVRIETMKVWPERTEYDYPYWGPGPYPYRPWPYPLWRDPFWGPYPYWWP